MLVEQKHTQSKGGWWLHPFIEHLVSQAHSWLAVKMVGRPSHPKLPLWHLYCGVTAKAVCRVCGLLSTVCRGAMLRTLHHAHLGHPSPCKTLGAPGARGRCGVRHPTSAETLVICGQLHLRNDVLNFFELNIIEP